MAQQDVSTFKTNKNLLLADNTSRNISESDMRTVFENTADSFLNKTDEFRDPIKAYAATHSSNNYTVTADNYASYETNIPFLIKPSATNSGSAPTININSLGIKTWKKADGGTYSASDISSGEYYLVVYDGTDFITLSGASGGGGGASGTYAITGFIESPTDKTYTLDLSAKFAYTIESLTIKTASGTVTAKIQIDSVGVTSISSVSVSSTETTATATGADSVSAGNTVDLVLSSSSSPENLSFTLEYSR